MAHDALAAHARDELGISETLSARPVQAALASAGFSVGAAMPLASVLVAPKMALIPVVVTTSIFFLAILGAFGAHAGGAPMTRAAVRVTFWGALAMALTAESELCSEQSCKPKPVPGRTLASEAGVAGNLYRNWGAFRRSKWCFTALRELAIRTVSLHMAGEFCVDVENAVDFGQAEDFVK